MINKALEKVAVVSGGTSGIGFAVVRRLLKEGFRVGFFGSSAEKVQSARSELLGAGIDKENFVACPVDLRHEEKIDEFFDMVVARFGVIGALVNNAGISPKRDGKKIPLHETLLSEWRDVIEVNLTSSLTCTQKVLPSMIAARYGRIVMMGSIAARALPRFAGTAYVASKAGLAGLARGLTSEYAAFGIVTNTLCPGNIATGMTGDVGSPQNVAAALTIPAGRIGLPDDLSGLVALLCSPEAEFINGATIDVTGGEYICP
ncbi:SDR family NAD(P)-dependent oxidoreductase [Mesorhizobium sp. B4-1-4]|uniref:SDR family NAD(P)-dependent oxidoreductase n=1 Tax=Mesorhizobium sp. B4-1-4 TaxID=2589888 RepID=UPI001127142A|nr:SDR family NAD(P)-dependent oxidoreductase [Mesorhizobium sp. B4-1-4]UCI31902.1 SDR family oxidoreductase [Mesorhizobium sp. B4-1-4]